MTPLSRVLAAAWLIVAAAAPVLADFSFVHTSDTHINPKTGPGSNAEMNSLLYEEISALTPLPALLINTGDVCEYGTDEEYKVYRQTLEHLKNVVRNDAPGNHDVRWNPRGKEGYTLGVGQPLYRSWDHENVHFVTLDSTVLLQHWGHISQEQLDWLKQDLEKVGPDKPVVIGFHHWIGRGTVQVDNEQQLLDVVAPYNVRLWLQGHGHSDIQWNVNGVPAIMQKGLYQGSYSVIEVTGDTMKIRRRSLGKPDPKKDELIRDKSVPTIPDATWTDVMTIPLAKQTPPKWAADAKVEDNRIAITAQRGDLPEDAKVGYRVDSGDYQPMDAGGDSWTMKVPLRGLDAGEHIVTVQAILPDGRAYQKPITVTVTKPGAPKPVWVGNVGSAIQSRLVRVDQGLFVTTMGGDLVAFEPAAGKEKWRVKTGGAVFSTPHVDGNMIYFGSDDHFVYGVDANTRQVKWKTRTGGAVFGGPAVAQGVVCIASVDTKIYGLDAQTGDIRWTVKGDNMFQSKTATDGQRFFVGGWDNTIRCIDAASGKQLWAEKRGKNPRGVIAFAHSPAISSPTVGDGKVYVTSNDGVLHALAIDSGKTVWEFDNKKLGYSGPLFHDGKVYIAIGDTGQTFCLNASNGEKIWETSVGSVIYDSSFAHSSGQVFIGCVSGTFNALDAKTGEINWQYRLGPGHLLASPATDDDRVYIGNMSGRVVALPAKLDILGGAATQPAAKAK